MLIFFLSLCVFVGFFIFILKPHVTELISDFDFKNIAIRKKNTKITNLSFSDFFKIHEYKECIHALKIDNQNLHDQITELKKNTQKLEFQITELKDFINIRMPHFTFETFPSISNTWSFPIIWNDYWKYINHDDYYQCLRQERAGEPQLTPLELNHQTGTARFRGSETDYVTTLNSCQCMDFKRRALPCKHIYRLAHELDVFPLKFPVESVPNPCYLLNRQDIERNKSYLSSISLDLLSVLRRSQKVIVERKKADQLLRYNLAIISPNKYELLNTFKKEELIAMFPSNTSGIKSAKKSVLVEKIIIEHPEIILEIEKHTVAIMLSPYAYRLK